MKRQITIIAGHDTNEKREQQTRKWLEQHNVTIEEWNGLQVLTFHKAEMNKGQHTGEYCVGFDDQYGEPEESDLKVDLEVDPHDTHIEARYYGSYTCSCLGRACSRCNGELEAIERGENPYAHHTPLTISPAFQARMDSLLPARLALTIDHDEAAQLNTFYSGIDA